MDLSSTKETGCWLNDEQKDLSIIVVFIRNGIFIDHDVVRTDSYLDFTGLNRFLPVTPEKGNT